MIEGPVVSIKDLIGGEYNRFWHDKSFYRVVKVSRGSNKSKTAAINFVERIMKHPWANLLVVRRFSNTLKQSTYTEMRSVPSLVRSSGKSMTSLRMTTSFLLRNSSLRPREKR